MQPSDSKPQPSTLGPLAVAQPGESLVCSVKRHPIGIIGMYIGCGVLLIGLAVLAFLVVPSLITAEGRAQTMAISGLVFVILTALCLSFTFISNKIYWGNSWVVTTDSITETIQTGLFDKQSSQLSLGNLEDVTAEQKGLMAHIFNYGVLRVETAGERSRFIFPYCPKPNEYARQILAAREAFEQRRQGDEEQQRLYRSEGAYQGQEPASGSQPAAEAVQSPSPTTDYSSEDSSIQTDRYSDS